MFLEQINRRLASYAASLPAVKKKERAMERAQPSSAIGQAPAPGTMKTIGVRVDAETYAALKEFMKSLGMGSMREAAAEAIKLGLKNR